MMTNKKRIEIEAKLRALLQKLPGDSAREWLEQELIQAKTDPKRDFETLEMLCASLEKEVRSKPKGRAPRNAATR